MNLSSESEINFSADGLSFLNASTNMGVKDIGFQLTVEGKDIVANYGTATDVSGTLIAAADVGNGLSIQTTVTPVAGLNAVMIQHRIMNAFKRSVFISKAATGQFSKSAAVLHGKGSWLGWDLRYCHTDNVRTERYSHCQMEYPYVRMLPVETTRLDRGEDQAFPALFIKDLKGGRETFDGEFITKRLEGRSSLLFDIIG